MGLRSGRSDKAVSPAREAVLMSKLLISVVSNLFVFIVFIAAALMLTLGMLGIH